MLQQYTRFGCDYEKSSNYEFPCQITQSRVLLSLMNLEALESITLSIVEAREVNAVLRQIVEGVAEQSNAALVRLWLIAPGDICAQCRFRKECPDQTQCLHLMASFGHSLSGDADYSRVDGAFRRIPIGARKVGRIAREGQAMHVPIVTPDQPWIADRDWIIAEGVKSFAGQPLIFRGRVLGVLCIFDRSGMAQSEFKALRAFAGLAAVAIANARAFEEIENLKQRLENENAYLQEEVREASDFGNIVGQSPALKNVLHQIELVARTDAGVLILGESGAGKELVARAIHERSARSQRPLIKVNCGAIPENLFESEMFGHVKGAFTGAIKDRAGRFELADGGTLFLDEVGEVPLALQAKLLRVLQEQQFERVGEERTRRVNVRVVAATNRDLKGEVEAGRFRRDLFYRLSVFPIEVPPLRERVEDVSLLAESFLRASARKLNLKPKKLAQSQIDQLRAYDWPGNVRELQNVIEHALILSQNGPLVLDLPASGKPSAKPAEARTSESGAVSLLTRAAMKDQERENIRAALSQTNGKIFGAGGAAELLGMKGTTLASRIKALKIRRN
jgi:transcriptional regulator with GAF, ATPase, and Fis domain